MATVSNLKNTTILATLIVSGFISAAEAQQNNNFYSRDKFEAVKDRYQPEFDPEPIRLGGFLVDSALEAGISTTDNVFSASDGPLSEESDLIARLGFDVRARTDWSNHGIDASAKVFRNEYTDFSEESSTNVDLGLGGKFDVSREFQIGARATFRDAVEQRQTFASAAGLDRPVEFQRAGVQVFANYQNDRIRWQNSVGVLESDYEDGAALDANGVSSNFDQDFRDRQDFTATSRISYAITPNVAVFGQGQYRESEHDSAQFINQDGFLVNQNNVNSNGQFVDANGVVDPNTVLTPVFRDSEGYSVQAGVDFEPATLIRGEVAVGYFEDDKKDEFFSDVDGLSVDARLQWFPSRLTTVEFKGGRRAQDNGLVESPSTLQTSYGARVDHELYRNIVLSGFVDFLNDEYEGLDREDDIVDLGASVSYKLTKRVHLEGFYVRSDRDSSGFESTSIANFDPSFEANTFGIAIRLHP